MFDLVPQPVRNLVDTIFGAPIGWLQLMANMIGHAGLVAGKGINLNNYFSFFGYLPSSWQLVVKSALSGIVLLATLFLVKAGWNMYLKVKSSTKWW
ncbi:hypothetical protein [uncultured Chitinophaga sp.]|jgi:hypothetical protein|uniref:hypothetical protein n=1 Tax=uncultured Chitinophaga sp. TaxID=339340 RepID=UPI0026285503|nr:hypothetical protein [uncultured Chitinophaga sp.]